MSRLKTREAEVDSKFVALQARIIAGQSGVGATTNAQFYSSVRPMAKPFLSVTGASSEGLNFDFALISEHEKAWINERTDKKAEKKFHATESNTVQPIWSEYLSTSGIKINGQVLKYSNHVKVKNETATLRWEDRHTITSIGTGKPDECLFVAEQPSTAYYIAVVGDLKGPGCEFADDAKGHILSFMVRLMEKFQPFRQFVIGYLRNSDVIQFFHATRDGDSFKFLETPEYKWSAEGGDLFACLLVAEPAQLGWCVPTLPFCNLKATAFLGSGASCSVYATDKNTAIKIFKHEREMVQEVKNLEILNLCSKLQGFVPKVLQHKGFHVEVSPIGKHYTDNLERAEAESKNADLPQLAVFGRKHIMQLIDVVAASPLIHRDLHPDNMYITPTGNLLLNDWGLAVEPNTQVKFVGVEEYVSFAVLAARDTKAEYAAVRKDDLHAVVRIAYRVLHAHDFKRIAQGTPVQFWMARLSDGRWAAAEAAAASDNLVDLKSALSDLMPW
jgi:hypothetical protein